MNTSVNTTAPTADPAELALLAEAVRDAMSRLYPDWPDDDRAGSWHADRDLLADLGLWSTLDAPDGSLAAASVVAEELGRALYPGPVAETLSAAVLSDALDVSEAVLGHAHRGHLAPIIAVDPGTALLVVDGEDLRVLSVGDAECRSSPTIDVTRRFIEADLAPSAGRGMNVQPGAPARALAALRMLYAADTLGGLARIVERTVEYAGQRTTFGVPIGKNQSVAHRLVEHTVTLRQMRHLHTAAVRSFDNDDADRDYRVALAECLILDRAADIISDCIQLSGAIGFTWEYGYHFFVRRAWQNATARGGVRAARIRLATLEGW